VRSPRSCLTDEDAFPSIETRHDDLDSEQDANDPLPPSEQVYGIRCQTWDETVILSLSLLLNWIHDSLVDSTLHIYE